MIEETFHMILKAELLLLTWYSVKGKPVIGPVW